MMAETSAVVLSLCAMEKWRFRGFRAPVRLRVWRFPAEGTKPGIANMRNNEKYAFLGSDPLGSLLRDTAEEWNDVKHPRRGELEVPMVNSIHVGECPHYGSAEGSIQIELLEKILKIILRKNYWKR